MEEEEVGSSGQVCAEGRLTTSVVIICIIAASAGLMFGYDVGVSGGVTTIEPFLKEFFPLVLKNMAEAGTKQDVYCIFDIPVLTAFTSSLYIAGLVSSLVAGLVMTSAGRKGTLIISGIVFLIGSALNAFALRVEMLILGRIFLGFGVGFANQAAPVYLSEMAPPKWRGTLTTAFQFFLSFGVVIATLINFLVAPLGEQSWRVALGFAALPATIMTVGALFIPDTPSSLIQRGKVHAARESLNQVRGIDSDNEAELNDLISSNEEAKATRQPPYKLMFHQRYRPHLVLTVAIGLFQQLTGINMVAFYAPVLFRTFGSNGGSALLGAMILGLVNCGSALVSTYLVDRTGRRFLYFEGAVQIIICQVAIACLLAVKIGVSGTELTNREAVVMLILMCGISAAFGWSWGPLTWVIPSEILPLEVRPGRPGNLHRRQLRPHIFSSSDIDDHALPSQVRRVPALRLTGPSHDCFLGSVFARDQRNSHQVHGCCLEGALVLASVR
ncbi:major facilitator superfamily protein [Actinidia rufa]|uniref:Major facilitator superfamily protein n=1 Tax=Actinidia rufa TaxID=165716 RepID=A0A7J0ET07_9ERIC|nr:major facilitator superfamily protein [Actinidia rufa]